VKQRLLLSVRRAIIDALLGFSLAAPLAAILAASGRLFGKPSLVDTAVIVPVAAACLGLIAGMLKVLTLSGKKLSAWLDIHTGAKGSLAAASEPPASPLFSLIHEKAALALKTAGLRYLTPFLPAWAPLVLAAAALWGMAFLIPQATPRTAAYVQFGGVAGAGASASPENRAAAESEWTRLLLVKAPKSAPGVSDTPDVSLPKPPDNSVSQDASQPNPAANTVAGSATTAKDTAEKSGASPSKAVGSSATASAQSTAPGRAAIADSPLPLRWKRVVTEYERLLQNESALK
jgi:hypothetical protein